MNGHLRQTVNLAHTPDPRSTMLEAAQHTATIGARWALGEAELAVVDLMRAQRALAATYAAKPDPSYADLARAQHHGRVVDVLMQPLTQIVTLRGTL